MNFRELLDTMIEKRAVSVKTYLDGNPVEITLSESAFRSAELGAPPASPDEVCACGHPLYDHTQAGCVHPGCEPEGCGREEAKDG